MSRPLSALFALWFALVSSEPPALHVCAMHAGGHAAHGAAPAAGAHEHGAPSAGTHEHGAPSAGTHDERDPSAPDATCTCLGDCCAAAASPLPSAQVSLVAAVVVVAPVAIADPATRRADVAPRLLPFATAPPGALPTA